MELVRSSSNSDGHVVSVERLSELEKEILDSYQGHVSSDGLLFFRPYAEAGEYGIEWPDKFHDDRVGKSLTFAEMHSGEQFYFDRRFSDGRIYMFDPETGARNLVAENLEDFVDDYLCDDECMELFRELLETTHIEDVASLPIRVFGTLVPTALGGSYAEREWIDRVNHFDVLAQVYRQVNDR